MLVLRHPDAHACFVPSDFQIIETTDPTLYGNTYRLWQVEDRLECLAPGDHNGVCVRRKDIQQVMRARGNSDLVRACGVKAGDSATILDGMAGWGVDGLTLAAAGCHTTLLENSSPIYALLRNALVRLGTIQMQCHHADLGVWLADCEHYDVVYLDPMFPVRNKKALPGRRMQMLAELAAPNSRRSSDWLAVAKSKAARVVIKRRAREPQLDKPDWSIKGRTVRFDVYLSNS